MVVIFGGRNADQRALNDAWGLRTHHDNTWDWVKAPYKPGGVIPLGRYQHSSLFLNSYMAIIGGKTNLEKTMYFNVYDTETGKWFNFNPVKRFRHASWITDGIIYVFGGFYQDTPDRTGGV